MSAEDHPGDQHQEVRGVCTAVSGGVPHQIGVAIEQIISSAQMPASEMTSR